MGVKNFDEHKSNGLALLLNHEPDAYAPLDGSSDGKLADNDLASAVAYVLELAESEAVPCQNGTIDFSIVDDIVARHVAEVQSQTSEPQTSGSQHEPTEPSTSEPQQQAPDKGGRIGPSYVVVDRSSATGDLVYDFDKFALESFANFSSCRASTCVFKGKWMYEAIVATDGIQQIGWATLDCPFTAEEGVGDFRDSYAYDGKRVHKWNVDRQDYGQPWAPGDVIGCCIDLDKGEITFHRNGVSMGVAYDSVRTMQTRLAYFPAISLSYAERCELNFGQRPFLHPVPGFLPLSDPPLPTHQALATYILSSFKRLVKLYSKSDNDPTAAAVRLPRGSLLWEDAVLLSDALLQHLTPLLTSPHIVEAHLLPCLLDLHGPAEPHRPTILSTAVRLLRISLPTPTFNTAFTNIFSALSIRVKTGPLLPDPIRLAAYPHMTLALALSRIPGLRDVLASHPHFLFVTEAFLTRKQPTTGDLKIIIPQVWWPGNPGGSAAKEIQAATKAALAAAEEKQDEVVYGLMCSLLATSRPGAAAGKSAFEVLLEHVVHKNREASRDVPPAGLSDPTVVKTLFYVVLRMLRHHLALAGQGTGGLATFPIGGLFVQGRCSPALTDPMAALSRLGGLVSHLTREVPVSKDHLAPVAVDMPATLSSPDPDPAVVNIPDATLPKFLAAALLLYNWKVGPSIHLAYNLLMSSINTASSLEELERHIRRSHQGVDYQQYLSELRSQLQEELGNNARKLSLVQPVFGSLQKMESMFTLAVYLSRLVHHASSLGPLLSWLPAPCMDIPLDLLLWLRRTETHFASPAAMEAHGLHCVIALLPSHLNEERICNPEVKEAVLTGTAALLEVEDYAAILERNEAAQKLLVPSVLDCFDTKLWHSVSIILQRMLRASGFGKASQHKPLSLFQQQVQAACQDCTPSSAKFLNRLLNTLNWALTEFSIIITDAHQHPERWSQPSYHQDPSQSVRKCIIMFDLSCQLLRILEFVAREAPSTFLDPPRLNLTRLLEVLGFVLSHFTIGPDARKLKAVLQRAPSRGAAFLALDRISLATVLAPVAGILLGLYAADVEGGQGKEAGKEPASPSPAYSAAPTDLPSTSTPSTPTPSTPSSASTPTPFTPTPTPSTAPPSTPSDPATDPSTPSTSTRRSTGPRRPPGGVLVTELASSSNAQLLSCLEFLPSLDWKGAFPNDPTLPALLQKYDQLLDKVRTTKAELEARAAAAASSGAGGPGGAEPPEEFLDPITQEVMEDPVVLPDSGVTLDRITIQRHFLSHSTDPFSRKELTIDMLKADDELRERILKWREEQER